MYKVSIIIINYNGAHHLEENLLSLKNLDYPESEIELIVFDNGSKDNSIEIIESFYPDAMIIRSDINTGFAKPHWEAARKASGDVLAFLNNDMRVDSEWIMKGVSMLNRSEGVVCTSSRILNWKGDGVDFCGGTLQYLGFADQIHSENLENGSEILFPCGGAMFIYRDIFLESGCFDGDYFAIFEDVDLGWRLWVMGYRVIMATDSVVYHKGHGTLDTKKESKKRYLMHRNALMTLIKNYSDENLSRILPLALVFAVKRSLLFMGVDKRSYYFWETDGSSGEERRFVPDNYDEACIHLAALDDVFQSFRSLSDKRKFVQSRRKREDSEIFRLFKEPFRNIMGYRDYLWDEVALFGKFSLENIFDCSEEYSKRVDDGNFHARAAMEEMVAKIRGEFNFHIPAENESQQCNPPGQEDHTRMIPPSIFSRLCFSLGRDGVFVTLKRALRKLLSPI